MDVRMPLQVARMPLCWYAEKARHLGGSGMFYGYRVWGHAAGFAAARLVPGEAMPDGNTGYRVEHQIPHDGTWTGPRNLLSHDSAIATAEAEETDLFNRCQNDPRAVKML